MNELHRRGEAYMFVTLVATKPRACECEQGAKAFSAGRDQMARQFGDQWNIRLHAIHNKLVHPRQVGRAKAAQIVVRIRFRLCAGSGKASDNGQDQSPKSSALVTFRPSEISRASAQRGAYDLCPGRQVTARSTMMDSQALHARCLANQ